MIFILYINVGGEKKYNMIDNFEIIKKFLKEHSLMEKNDFYFLQVIRRKKDNPEMTQHEFNIDNFYLNSFEDFDKKKERARSLIVREEVEEIWSNNSISSSELSNDAPGTYDSGLFSGLGFQDLYKAHTETVIPVTEEDYEQKQKFGSVNEYMSYRNNQDTKPLSEQQAEQYLKQRNEKDEEKAVRRAYELAKQTEMAKQKNQEFWSGLQLLKNK